MERRLSEPNVIAEDRPRYARIAWLISACVFLGSVGVLYFFNPVEHPFFPRCMFHAATGWDCPGCGGLRAAHQLLHGNIAAAFRFNPLLICALPIVSLFALRWLFRGAANRESFFARRPKLLWIFAAVVIGFGLLRNLPWKHWAG